MNPCFGALVTLFLSISPAWAQDPTGVKTLETRPDQSLLVESQGEQYEVKPVVVEQKAEGTFFATAFAGVGGGVPQGVTGRLGVLFLPNKPSSNAGFLVVEADPGLGGLKLAAGGGVEYGDGSLESIYNPLRGGLLSLKGVVYTPWKNIGPFHAERGQVYGGAEVEGGSYIFRFSVGYLRRLSGTAGKKQGLTAGASIVVPVFLLIR
ncbi:MAG TPA: hypothetical protein VM598_04455 [Bdellovibrionota bacterium]|nr:hypothetical protein [Bdellovibrionota bacterium]